MSNTVFYTIGIACMSGIFIRSFFYLDYSFVLWLLFIGCTFLIIEKIAGNKQRGIFVLLSILLFFMALGVARLHYAEEQVSVLSEFENQEITFRGYVLREPELRATSIHLYVRPASEAVKVREFVLVTVDAFDSEARSISYGDELLVTGTLTKPEAFESNGGREFDYPGYLKSKKVSFVVQKGNVSLASPASDSFLSNVYTGKGRFIDAFEAVVPMPHAGLGEGVLLGVKRALGTELEETFRETGIIHIVVLSGYNVMIVIEALVFVLAYFFLPRTRMVLGLGVIVLFVLLVGPSATVVRASIMAGLLLIARATGRTYALLRALLLAGVVMLMVNPYLLVHDPGFQLSFLATLALILFAPPIEEKLIRIPEILGIRKIVTATLTTQIFVLPLLLYHMGLLSLVSVVVNVLVLPMVPIAMLLTFITGMVGMYSNAIGIALGYLAYLSLGYIIVIAEFFGSLPLSSFTIERFPAWIMFGAYGLMTIGTVYFMKEKESDKLAKIESITKMEGWTIEEETEEQKTAEAQSASAAGPLPFR